jgi:hypothetical protein
MVGFMPCAMRVDRLLGEHGVGQDSAAGRQEFGRQMERRRLEAIDEEGHSPPQRPRQAGQRCPTAERNDPADQIDSGGIKHPTAELIG